MYYRFAVNFFRDYQQSFCIPCFINASDANNIPSIHLICNGLVRCVLAQRDVACCNRGATVADACHYLVACGLSAQRQLEFIPHGGSRVCVVVRLHARAVCIVQRACEFARLRAFCIHGVLCAVHGYCDNCCCRIAVKVIVCNLYQQCQCRVCLVGHCPHSGNVTVCERCLALQPRVVLRCCKSVERFRPYRQHAAHCLRGCDVSIGTFFAPCGNCRKCHT